MDKTKKLVLTIEDQPAIADLLGFLLDATELEVKRSDNGSEGLDMIKTFKPDLVIMDVMMPTMDGWQVFDAVRQDESVQNIPIIMLSVARQDPDRRIAFRGSHLDFYMTKPFDVVSLRRMVQEILGLEIWLKSTPITPLSGKSTQPLPPLPPALLDSTSPPAAPVAPAPSTPPIAPTPSVPTVPPTLGAPAPSTSSTPPAAPVPSDPSAPSSEPTIPPVPVPQATPPAPPISSTPQVPPIVVPSETSTLSTPPMPPIPPEPSAPPQVKE